MRETFAILMAANFLGGADVLYYHLYRFRLCQQPGSRAEEVTHLLRGVLFAAIVAIVLFAPPTPETRAAVLGLFTIDLANTIADVLLERRSREPLGGLESGEYLIHILGGLAMGVGLATFWWRAVPGSPVLERTPLVLGLGLSTIAGAAAATLFEAVLFARAIGRAPRPTT